MKRLFIILFVFSALQAGLPIIEHRFAGIVTDYKILSFQIDSSVEVWVQTDQNQYVVRGVNGLPYIYVGDSLFEYWINYSKCCVGTKKRSALMYSIVKR